MVDPIDTSKLGPVRIDPGKSPQRQAQDRWWSSISRQGDPIRRPDLVGEAHAAGWQAGLRFAEQACDLPPHYLDKINSRGGIFL